MVWYATNWRIKIFSLMSYENFAYYYDSLMDEQFYDDYFKFINEHADFKSVLELGCGTGEIAIRLAKAGKEIYATDLSKDMLSHGLANLALQRPVIEQNFIF